MSVFMGSVQNPPFFITYDALLIQAACKAPLRQAVRARVRDRQGTARCEEA